MAYGQLIEVPSPTCASPGESWFLVTADVFSAAPVGEGEALPAFTITGPGTAEFTWLSSIDIIYLDALAVARGEIRVDSVDGPTDTYLQRKVALSREAAEDSGDDEWKAETDDEIAVGICEQIAMGLTDVYEQGEVLDLDDDSWLADAARALVLPDWARVEFLDDGGVGCGYDQPYVVLENIRTLTGLLEFLASGSEDRLEAV